MSSSFIISNYFIYSQIKKQNEIIDLIFSGEIKIIGSY